MQSAGIQAVPARPLTFRYNRLTLLTLHNICTKVYGNGRIGRLLMLKECLRHGITPFILDDKRRSAYLDGIRCWEKDPLPLMQVCMEA